MELVGKVSTCPAFGGGGLRDATELEAGLQLPDTNPPHL